MSERYAGELEDAPALVDRLRAELVEARADLAWRGDTYARLTGAEAAIARVRELCIAPRTIDGEPFVVVATADVLAALDGAE